MASPLLEGAECLVHGFSLMIRPGLKRYVVIPLLINSVIFALVIWLAGDAYAALLHRLIAELPSWLAWIGWLMWLLFAAAILLAVFFGFALVANFVAAPFNEILSARLEAQLTGSQPSENGRGVITSFVVGLGTELRKAGYALMLAAAAGLLGLLILFVPGLQILTPLVPVIWFVFGAWTMALEYSDYPLGNHGLGFGRQRALLRRHRPHALGFGGAVALLTMVPVINFLVMPAAVAGATLLWTRILPVGERPSGV